MTPGGIRPTPPRSREWLHLNPTTPTHQDFIQPRHPPPMSSSEWNTAPYGRACVSCAQAKCKCLVTEAGGSCARCRRLHRECRSASRTRKTNPSRSSAAAKTAQLEKRLDELTSLLKATGQNSSIPPGQALSDSGFSSGSHVSGPQSGPQSPVVVPPVEPSIPVHGTYGTHPEDDDILESFRVNRLPTLPIIHIPPTTTAASIKAERPFLWHCLVTLACKDTPRRRALHDELKARAAQALLVDCERSLDLLLGVLVYMSWVGYECQPRKLSLGPYMQMLVGLVLDIGLNRPPPMPQEIPGLHFLRNGPGVCRPWTSLVRTMEERRAVLGCFLVCSALSHTLNRTDSLGWTPHMTECLEALAEAKEAPGDALLVQLVRTQLVLDKTITELGFDYDNIKDRDSCQPPLSFYIKGLQSQIDEIKKSTPPHLAQNTTLLLHWHYAETKIYETALVKAATEEPHLARLDQLYTCLAAVQKRFDVFFGLPDRDFAYFPATILFPTAHSLITLLRLSTFEYPGWDLLTVRQTIDLLSTTQRVADRLAHAPSVVGIRNAPDAKEGEHDCFTGASRILSGLRATWAARLPDLTPPAVLPTQQQDLLPEFDPEMADGWLSAQDVAWLTEFPLYGGGFWAN
ncbi:hypothetical protein BJX70DRAFT_352582 [Aspergillus crustosus]